MRSSETPPYQALSIMIPGNPRVHFIMPTLSLATTCISAEHTGSSCRMCVNLLSSDCKPRVSTYRAELASPWAISPEEPSPTRTQSRLVYEEPHLFSVTQYPKSDRATNGNNAELLTIAGFSPKDRWILQVYKAGFNDGQGSIK